MNGPGGPRVLVVDDEAALRRSLRRLLERAGMEVAGEAGDGAEGLALALELKPDMVLMDLRMPVMGGFEAGRRIKEAMPGTHVLILTGYDDEEFNAAAAKVGAATLIKGATPPQEIVATILRLLESTADGMSSPGSWKAVESL